jgi:hypothetical protein
MKSMRTAAIAVVLVAGLLSSAHAQLSDTTPPTVAITSPASGATVSGTISVTANASDNVGVVGVQFKYDGNNFGGEDLTAPYSAVAHTTSVPDGTYTLTAVARDAAGNRTTSAPVTITVANDTTNDTTLPAVAITSPASGATVSGTITVTADASDNVGVVGVQFQYDGINFGGEDTTAPYSASANTTQVPDGTYTLTAIARDAAGNRTTSAPVTITVDNNVTVDNNKTLGQWTLLAERLPYASTALHLLPTGKVLFFGAAYTGTDTRLWDPATGTTSLIPLPGYNVFCAGHAFLADGRLLVAGGHISNDVGLPHASTYDSVNNTWTPGPDMNAGRWYPTVTTLANGDALVVAGEIDVGVNNTLPEVYQAATGTWHGLTGAQRGVDLYPWMHLAPNGKVFLSGPSQTTGYLDTQGTGRWTGLAPRNFVYRSYGSSVMYDDGKVLVMGGGDPPTNTAEVIDLNAASPSWRAVGSMAIARRQLNATLLPDGKVLVTGGTSGPGHNNASTAVFMSEMWDPATELWTTLASAQVIRIYHSAALLLPDGRVLSTGGDGKTEVEVYSPPYLFTGSRPTISAAPAAVSYGQTFFVETPDTASIAKVTWIRLGSVTHAFNQNQRINRLNFSQAPGGLNIVAPANANLAPPGHYMLFLLDGNGAPSIARIVRIGS